VTDTTTAPATASKSGPLVLRTSIGKKYAMATSGIILVGFVIAHMVGNLKFFFGEKHFDDYAAFLRKLGDPIIPHYYALWGLRAVLLAAVCIHIWAAYMTTVQSKKARPIGYAHTDNIQATYASRTMRWGGVILLLFIVFHILDLTIGAAHWGKFAETTAEHGHAYANAVSGFQHPLIVIVYTIAMGALCLHLFHGVWSMFQTFGRNNAKVSARLRQMSAAISVIVCLGFLSVPWAVMFGARP
jgi:succinate dehydrogenase / fumarate reductase cytochrome b subunit